MVNLTNSFFEKAIFHDAFDDVVNDAVDYARLVAPVAVPLGIVNKRREFFVQVSVECGDSR